MSGLTLKSKFAKDIVNAHKSITDNIKKARNQELSKESNSHSLSNSTSQEQFLTINCIKQKEKDSTEENSSLSFSASKINNKISPKKDKINEPELGLNNSNYKETENSQVKIIDKANDNTNFTNCTTINYSRTPTYKIKNKNTDITEITKKCEIKTDTVISPEFPENKSIKDREILDSRVDKNLVHNTAELKGHKKQGNNDEIDEIDEKKTKIGVQIDRID